MDPQTQGRVVVITGASSGIGRAGARLVLAARLAGFRILEATQPAAKPGPASR